MYLICSFWNAIESCQLLTQDFPFCDFLLSFREIQLSKHSVLLAVGVIEESITTQSGPGSSLTLTLSIYGRKQGVSEMFQAQRSVEN